MCYEIQKQLLQKDLNLVKKLGLPLTLIISMDHSADNISINHFVCKTSENSKNVCIYFPVM